jgi:hypothetical protein
MIGSVHPIESLVLCRLIAFHRSTSSDDAHNSRVVSIDTPIIHDLRIMDSEIKQMCQKKITTVMLGSELINFSALECLS